MSFDGIRGYVQLASGLGEATRARATEVAQSLLMAGEKTALQILPVERATEKFEALGTLLAGSPDAFVQDYKV